SAAHDTLVFVDARVVVSPDLLDVFWRAGYSPLIGVVRPSADGDEINPAERIFYLIRRRYYIPRMLYGAGAGFAYIDKDNFSRSPKGAGCFFVRKDVFLASVPEAFDKYTNDDTAIFRHIVFGMNTPIMRHFGVTLRHSHRTDPARFIEWLMYRGSSFYDFYLRRSMVLRAIFAAGSAILFLVFLYCIVHPRLFLYTAFFVLPVYAIAVVFLAERVRDTAVVFPRLWAYILLFYGGMVRRAIITRFR
ncbi:MAG: hypothetical protein PHT32_03510, partial [Candidatus Omnitrophica bacterium]|nr:hypothetical protein [Candidatus Omnitrophota bacterium]